MESIGRGTCQVLTTPESMQAVREPLNLLLSRLGSRGDALARARRFFAPTANPTLSHFVTAVWQGTDLRGVVYSSQRKILELPFGVLYVGFEDYGDGGVIAHPRDRSEVLGLAIRNLLLQHTVHTITLQGDTDSTQRFGPEFAALTGASCSFKQRDTKSILPLADSFDTFLRSLGKHTRRNLVYYRRRASANGWIPVEQLPSQELADAIEQLVDNQRTSWHTVDAILTRCEILNTKPGAFWSGLRTPAGSWLALIGGWREGDHAFIICQLNHSAEQYRQASLSTVMRAHLIERLIASGVRELTFVNGCKGILEPFCKPLPCHVVTIKKRGVLFSLRRTLLAGALRIRHESRDLRARFSSNWLSLPVRLGIGAVPDSIE